MRWTATVVAVLAAAAPTAAQALPAASAGGRSVAVHRLAPGYSFRGRLTAFVPARGPVDGSVTIRVSWGSMPLWLEPGTVLTFRVTSSTVLSPSPAGDVQAGDWGVVRVPAVVGGLLSVTQLQSQPAQAITVFRRSVMQPLVHPMRARSAHGLR